MRTQTEIIDQIKNTTDDVFGFTTMFLVPYLNFENAKPFIRKEITEEEWETKSSIKEDILKEMEAYMPFAWEKANGFRGLSAARSLTHYNVWLWLSDTEFPEFTEDYEYYGKDHLVSICNKFNWDSKQWDDGIRLNEEPAYT